jgi:hypothetical protein
MRAEKLFWIEALTAHEVPMEACPSRQAWRDPHRGKSADAAVRSGAAGIAAVQRAELTRLDQATLLQRVWGVDALACGRCGGPMRFISVIKDRAVIERILQHLGIAHDLPRFARARDPCAFAD